MRIALDAMGGDFAPSEIVKGAAEAVRELGVEVLLVGDEAKITLEVEGGRIDKRGLSILHTSEFIPMDEHHPLDALRRNPRASVLLACELVARGEADACVSAGNTGASLISGLKALKRVEGVDRPAIGTPFPTPTGICLIIDAGANVDVKPEHLLSFGIMGSIYMERVLGIESPRVGLLNIGEEASKGNDSTIKAHALLAQSGLNFIGNIEGKDIPQGAADVVVCDGFIGNVVLKLAEGLGTTMLSMMKSSLGRSFRTRLGGLLAYPAFRELRTRMDYEEYGGALLLGVNGVLVISHGRSRARAIKNAVRVAKSSVMAHVVDSIREGIRDRDTLPDKRTV